ncbi:cysteine--tRNA ligase [Phenylobacterium hankyongense]|uniref:Cysteine--tRNA ligase n=1 Tax=Phenylobacterium hankyongense TaxID=1813876 RepID=A0A328B1Z7_9CAUL|nr:cysteine--tRNA ligase [Phenylobacterium hankyongense]RAK59936.1 cysteine--tRNA ligase [Phenylobacterium hankyongense]
MTLALYDTMARAKRPFVPRDPRRVTMYVCGPTVYNYAHIGNFRPVVVFDLLFRVLRRIYGDQAVLYAANVTDVDDKINAKAQAEGVPIAAVTDRYLEAYNADAAALGALPPTAQPRVTETMDAIIKMIARLVDNGAAYAAEGHVLFDTQAYGDYGKLSGRSLDDMIAGARVDVAPYKRHPADFVLWKPSKPGEPQWESPWGSGRPGWHIECSAMIEQVLGLPIDIHGGGIDLVFPHHENERAQGVCATHDHTYSNFWLHNGFLNFGDEKMSKSLGNVTLAHDLLKQAPGEAIRWALLSAHYRQPLAWTEDVLTQARNSLDHLYGVLQRAREIEPGGSDKLAEDQIAPLLDDLNTPQAMTVLKGLANDLDRAVRKGASGASEIKQDLMALAEVMGFLQADPDAWFQGGADDGLKTQIEALIVARDAARAAKDWPQADRIRAELTALNVEVMDGPAGATWRIKEQA